MKFKNIFLCLIMCLSVVSCSKKTDKVLIDSTYETENTIALTHDTLEAKLVYKDDDGNEVLGDNFILYVYTPGCSACHIFETYVLKEYISYTSADIYKIDVSEIDGLIKTPKSYSENPRLCIFKEGKIFHQITAVQDSEVFLDHEKLNNYIEKYCIISPMLRVTFEQLTRIITQSNMYEYFVYYQMSGCGDCAFFEKNILNNWLKNNQYITKKFFVYDVLEFRKYKTDIGDGPNEELYNNMVDICQLDINGNRGKYPTLVRYKQGRRDSYCIYFNDDLEYNETNKTFKVVNTPYGVNQEIVGKEYSSYDEYQRLTSSFHEAKFLEFINNIYEIGE